MNFDDDDDDDDVCLHFTDYPRRILFSSYTANRRTNIDFKYKLFTGYRYISIICTKHLTLPILICGNDKSITQTHEDVSSV